MHAIFVTQNFLLQYAFQNKNVISKQMMFSNVIHHYLIIKKKNMLICNVCRESNNHCHFFFYDFSDCNGSKKYCGDVKYQYSMQSCRSLLPRTPMQSAHVKIFGGNLKKCIQKIHSNFIKKIIILIQNIDIYI